jgi:fermentation-respiration switch protein FrsA (DUF1100 family)
MISRRFAVTAVLGSMLTMGGCGLLDEHQRRWVFQPSRDTWRGGGSTEGMLDVFIEHHSRVDAQTVRLHGLWLPQADPQAPLLLYLHGAKWDVRSSAQRIRRLHGLGFAVLGIDYRGFGQSSDLLPSEGGAHEDVQAAWAWLADKRPQAPRYVYGHSLGSAIAVHLVAELPPAQRPAGLMLESAFPSVPAVASTFKWGWLPFSALVTQRFDSAARIARLGEVPTLFVHGANDRLIPPALGRALYEQARSPKRFVLVEGGTHHNAGAVGLAEWRGAMRELFGWGTSGGSGARHSEPRRQAQRDS